MSGGASVSLALYERSEDPIPKTLVFDRPLRDAALRSALADAGTLLDYAVET